MIILKRLSLPCPENRLYRAVPIKVRGRTIMKNILSKEAREKAKRCILEIQSQLGGRGPGWTGPVQANVSWTPRSRVCCDVMAYNKQLFDCIAKAGIVLDDKQIEAGSVVREAMPCHPGWVDVTLWEVTGA